MARVFAGTFAAITLIGSMIVQAAPPTSAPVDSLPCEKYSLENGMTVILHVDHTLPLAGVNLWYRVGARNEPPRRSGFAHLFEHLMFMGTRRVPGSGFDDLMEAGGGSNNADTTLDRTDYFSTGPSSLLPVLLWLDADRMEELGRTMSKEKLDKQRDVVRNEIRQQVENRPYGRAYEQSFLQLYPPTHPYHNGVYGTHEDLEAATVNDVKDFFATFYTPDNCSLVVAGDFDPAVIKPMIAKLYGSIPRGDQAPYPKVPGAKLDHVVRWTMFDKVQLPEVNVLYLSPGNFAEGDAEMNLIASILAEGKDGRLYRRLVVDDESAVSVSVNQDGAALSSVFRIEVQAKPTANLSKVEAAIDEELDKLITEGPTAEEVRRRASTTELAILRSMQDVGHRAGHLNEYEYYFGNPDSLRKDLERYRHATTDGVKQWARTVLTRDARLVTRVLPESPTTAPSDRDKPPAELPLPSLKVPEATTVTLSNGIPVYVFPRHDLPIVACSILIDAGAPIEPPARAGIASLAAEMTQEGAGELDSNAFAEAVAALGANVDAAADIESITVSGQVLSRNLAPAAKLMADAVLHPRMEVKDFERVKATHLDNLNERMDEPTVVAGDVASKTLFTEASRYALPTEGTVGTVSPLTLEDVKNGYRDLLKRSAIKVVVAGDVTPEQAKEAFEKNLAEWHGAPAAPATEGTPFRSAEKLRVFLVDRPAAVQTVIALVAPSAPFADGERVEADLANIILGGSFTSRLNRNLREEHGYTYGATSRLSPRRTMGTFVAAASVKADVTGPALKEFFAELRRMPTGDLTEDESRKARETYRATMAERLGTLDGLVRDANFLLERGAPLDTRTRELARAASTDLKALKAAAKGEVKLEGAVLVLVGDKKLVMEQMKGLGLPEPSVVDAEGGEVK